MKVNVNVTLDVDPEAWAIEFGLDQADKVIRKDVKTYFAGLCHDQLTVLQLGNREASFAGRTGTSPDGSLRHLQARPRRAASCRPGHRLRHQLRQVGDGDLPGRAAHRHPHPGGDVLVRNNLLFWARCVLLTASLLAITALALFMLIGIAFKPVR